MRSTHNINVYRVNGAYAIRKAGQYMVPRHYITSKPIVPGMMLDDGAIVQEIRENNLLLRMGWEDLESDFESAGVVLEPLAI